MEKRIVTVMALTTYAELQAAIADTLNRDDLTSVIPTFITLAEAEMNRRVRHWRMEKRSTTVLDTEYSALPSDFVEPIRLQVTDGGTSRLELISLSEMINRRDASNDTAGRPYYYAIIDNAIQAYPTPDDDYTLELVYYAKPNALSDSVASNWILQYFPDLYLYGSLTHSAPYLGEDARTAVWAGLYQNAIDGIIADNDKAKYGGTGHRMKIRSY